MFNFFTIMLNSNTRCLKNLTIILAWVGEGGGWWILSYTGYTVMCDPKGNAFSAILVINEVLILAILVLNRV